ncbi:MAG TPA: hypothetical protein VFT22_31155 [Kofleriaceae bacterium]|nr:hypothetical protein [Kofleriaceae bacterium]
MSWRITRAAVEAFACLTRRPVTPTVEDELLLEAMSAEEREPRTLRSGLRIYRGGRPYRFQFVVAPDDSLVDVRASSQVYASHGTPEGGGNREPMCRCGHRKDNHGRGGCIAIDARSHERICHCTGFERAARRIT